jgi:ribonuclease BN (tRNA processing enzyme)
MSQVHLQFLGSGDAFGSGGRLQTCIYVEAGIDHFLLDCGASSMIAMRRWHINPTSINTILLTHLHGDHFGGLPFFILDAHLVSKRTQPLIVSGPPGTQARIQEAQEILFSGSSHVQQKFPIQYIEWMDGKSTQVGALVVTPYQVIHASGAPAFALRVECEGKVIAYSGDTEWTDALRKAADGADLFICEAYYYDKKVKYHLDYQTLMTHRDGLACKRLIVTHMSEDLLGQLEKGDVEYAEDGKSVIIE